MSLPRMARISRSDICSRSLPAKRMVPAILPGGSGISRISDIEVTDLPQPDSPTMASVSPSLTWKDTPSTARLMPLGVRKWVWRFSTSSNAIGISLETSEALGHARIERIAKAVAEQVHGEHSDGQEGRRKEHDVGLDLPERPPLGHDVAPGRNGRRRASADKRQDRFGDHGGCADIGRQYGDRRDGVGQDVLENDFRGARPAGDRRFDIGLLAQREHHAT